MEIVIAGLMYLGIILAPDGDQQPIADPRDAEIVDMDDTIDG